MPTEYVINPVNSYVAGAYGINSTDVTFTVSDASLFPTTLPYRILVDNEIMLLTGIAGNVFTVTRGEEGTVACAHALNAFVGFVLSAGGLYAVFGGGGGGGGGVAPCGGWSQNGSNPTLVGGAGYVVMPLGGPSLVFGGAVVSSALSANSGITPGTAGDYQVSVDIGFNGGAAGDIAIAIAVNGVPGGYINCVSDLVSARGSLTNVLSLLSTDEVEVLAAGTTGGQTLIALNVAIQRVN